MSRESLSSGFTFVHKFIALPLTLLAAVTGLLALFIYADGSLLLVGAIVILVLETIIYFLMARLYFVEYDNRYVYVRKFFKEFRFELYQVKSINSPYSFAIDPLFELEIEVSRSGNLKFDFLIHFAEALRYLWAEKTPQSIDEFNYLVKQAKETYRILQETGN